MKYKEYILAFFLLALFGPFAAADIFSSNQTQFYMSYAQSCMGARGQLDILDNQEQKIGAFQLICSAWQENRANLQLVDAGNNLIARTNAIAGQNNDGRVYLIDSEEHVVALLNRAPETFYIQGKKIATALTLYDPIASFPSAHISSEDFAAGQLKLRDMEGNVAVEVFSRPKAEGSCSYPQWWIQMSETSATLLNDPRIASFILAHLVLSKAPYNNCVELAWEPFGLTIIVPSLIILAAGIKHYASKWCRGRRVTPFQVPICLDDRFVALEMKAPV